MANSSSQPPDKMTTAYIGLGSNLGDGLLTLQKAWAEIGSRAGIVLRALSSPYLSAPVGMESENWFTNGVGRLETSLSAHDLLKVLLAVESSFGRRRDAAVPGYQDRTLDLDLIYFGKTVIDSEHLTLPHPFLGQRLFVLQPLAEIGAEYVDPADGLTPVEKLDRLRKQMESGETPLQEISKGLWE